METLVPVCGTVARVALIMSTNPNKGTKVRGALVREIKFVLQSCSGI